MEDRLNFNEINPAVWGVTYVRNVTFENPNDVLKNYDFQSVLFIYSKKVL